MAAINQSPLIVIVGPTASGKTATSIDLCKRIDGEVVSADSMQIYRDMDIGTAKPTEQEKQGITHHLQDFISPDQSYSVMQYQHDAMRVITEIHERGKIPVVCGGTGLYIESLLRDMTFTQGGVDYEYREHLMNLAQQEGSQYLHEMLKSVDPNAGETIHPNNVKRVIRALEVYHLTGIPFSRYDDGKGFRSWQPLCMIGLSWERSLLNDRINRRIDQMMEDGLEGEVRRLFERYTETGMSHTALQGIGYKEFLPYFHGECSLNEVIDTLKQQTRRYAKRQYTWFRRYHQVRWIEVTPDSLENDIFDIIFSEMTLKGFVFSK